MSIVRGVVVVVLLSSGFSARAGDEPAAPPKEYRIDFALKEAFVGVPSELSLVITPKEGWTLKLETPFSARLEGSKELTLEKSEFGSKDFVDPKTPHKTLKTSVTPSARGEFVLGSKLSFFLCNDMVCERHNEELSTKVAVKDPAK